MQLEMLRHCESAEAIVMHPEEALKNANENYRWKSINAIAKYRDEALKRAEEEMEFCRQHKISVLPITAEDYPARLRDCPDAPVVIFYRGTANLNAKHVVAVVGTRKISEYGKQLCARFTERLAELLPDTLVVSGLAYGVDIHVHRGCMEHSLPTVGVVAHGLDQIYPATHRNDAKRMLQNGGILTEYVRGTRPLQGNFLRRNRIVAGMADATIVVESAEHGGSLVTARIARSYDRAVFACPGRVNDPYSIGCNNLILNAKAMMMLSAEDVVKELGWWQDSVPYLSHPQQLDLFGNEPPQRGGQKFAALTPEQQLLAETLEGTDGLNTAMLAEKTHMAAADINAILFDMELSGIVKVLPGGFYMLTK
ncbi:MAG: DNA-processing protein DprA [Bacteroidales bacterium]|nr:DNA-processing protein DprA [Bacteroidales bacterium]